jgi:hypothetical protein
LIQFFFIKQNKDKQEETLFYQIQYQEISQVYGTKKEELQSIATLFSLIESNKEIYGIETYSLSQTTLEQVFLSFAKEQKAEIKNNKKNN